MTSHAPSFYFPAPRTQKFCTQCGNATTHRVPPDDTRERDVCEHCGAVHYHNPLNVVGVVPIWGEQVLLCRRAIEPRHGMWTLPAGFMELGETTAQGAVREAEEESGAQLELGPLYTVIDVPHVEQVHFFYLARVLSPDLDPGFETLEARFFDTRDIPWDELAFRTVRTTLEHYLEDRPGGRFPVHHYSLMTPSRG
ncbi:MAG TPA: NUDIX hydrolase [Burkholderiaceae bacterium]|nr:NUDIX hydrolase [Burkholderiaceae bacterium]